jgi:signal transduction histidine kinase
MMMNPQNAESPEGSRSTLTLRLPFLRITPLEALLLISLAITVIGVAVIGKRLERVATADTLGKTTNTLALYVDDVLESTLAGVDSTALATLSTDAIAELDRSLDRMTARADVVGLKLWNADGRLIYAEDSALIGRVYTDLGVETEEAWDGDVTWRISSLEGVEHALLRQSWDRLLEIFTPIQIDDDPEADVVAEFYYPLESLEAEIALTKKKSWLFMIAITFPLYLVLAVAARKTTATIWRQQDKLQSQVATLKELLEDNRTLHSRVRAAAMQATELNELFQRRFGSELHDGPVQHISYALLRLDAVRICFSERYGEMPNDCECAEQLERIRGALQTGITELRQLSSGLAGVDFNDASLGRVITAAVSQHIRKTKTPVALDARDLPDGVPLAVRIAAYRFVQESLNNAFQHGGAEGQRVRVDGNGDSLLIEVSDDGPGFEPEVALKRAGCLGLRGLRDRITVLGGDFDIDSSRGVGTKLTARLPLIEVDTTHAI